MHPCCDNLNTNCIIYGEKPLRFYQPGVRGEGNVNFWAVQMHHLPGCDLIEYWLVEQCSIAVISLDRWTFSHTLSLDCVDRLISLSKQCVCGLLDRLSHSGQVYCAYLLTHCVVPGISGKSQILFSLVFTTRYLDLLTSFISLYNTTMKVGDTRVKDHIHAQTATPLCAKETYPTWIALVCHLAMNPTVCAVTALLSLPLHVKFLNTSHNPHLMHTILSIVQSFSPKKISREFSVSNGNDGVMSLKSGLWFLFAGLYMKVLLEQVINDGNCFRSSILAVHTPLSTWSTPSSRPHTTVTMTPSEWSSWWFLSEDWPSWWTMTSLP